MVPWLVLSNSEETAALLCAAIENPICVSGDGVRCTIILDMPWEESEPDINYSSDRQEKLMLTADWHKVLNR